MEKYITSASWIHKCTHHNLCDSNLYVTMGGFATFDSNY